jgi:hypothetical protein
MTTPALRHAYRRHRYAVLFYTLLFTLVADPVFAALGWGSNLVEFFLAVNLMAAVASIDLWFGRPALVIAVAVVALVRLGGAWMESSTLALASLLVLTLAGLVAAGGALRYALSARVVSSEHLYAALSAYLLAGLFFGLAYWGLQHVNPNTLAGAAPESLTDAIYFSFVTLATLGYGDISPRGEIARGLAIVEGIGGQLFLAVMVARLVSLYVRKD